MGHGGTTGTGDVDSGAALPPDRTPRGARRERVRSRGRLGGLVTPRLAVTLLAATMVATSLVVAVGASAAGCDRVTNLQAQPVSGSAYRYWRGSISSYDCTKIAFNLFEPRNTSAARPAYALLDGPGWGYPGITTPDSWVIDHGYAELSWDPRGFGASGGYVDNDNPAAEGRDVSALIDLVLAPRTEIVKDLGKPRTRSSQALARQPKYTNDTPSSNTYGQPAVAMIGGSYGGAIQLATAAFDNRVKVITPAITWNDLTYSLFPNGVIKYGFNTLLLGLGAATGAGNVPIQALGQHDPVGAIKGVSPSHYNPDLLTSYARGMATGQADEHDRAFFLQRSMAGYGAGPAGHVPNVPTLFMQGTVDTLFNANEAWLNYRQIKDAHPQLPAKIIYFCGGHVLCPNTGAPPVGSGTGYSDTASKSSAIAPGMTAGNFQQAATLSWLDTYLRGYSVSKPNSISAIRLPVISYQAQDGNFYGAAGFPSSSDWFGATLKRVPISATLVSHGVPTGAGPVGVYTTTVDGPTAPSDPGQVTLPLLKATAITPLVGMAHVDVKATVTGSAAHLFFRLLDTTTGQVIDLQTTPLRLADDLNQNPPAVPSPARTYNISLDLAGVAYHLPPGHTVALQISTSSAMYMMSRAPSVVTVSGAVALPTLTEH